MNTESVVKNLRVLWRTDRIITDIRIRHLLVGLGLRAFAALIAAFGLLMLQLSAYFALAQIWNAISAAPILGAVNFVIAAILFAIAARPPTGRELELANEIHGSSVDALQLEARIAAVATVWNDPPPIKRNLASTTCAADHDHHQEPEEAGTSHRPRGGNRSRTELIAAAALGHSRQTRSDTSMQNASPKPILNTSLPAQFRQIRIELAREPGHPEGDTGVAYIIVAPLDEDDRIDPTLWRGHREACRIARLRPDQQEDHGHLVHRQGGGWAFHYDAAEKMPDEIGFHFADERFVSGEYVSINESGKLHTYRVASVHHL